MGGFQTAIANRCQPDRAGWWRTTLGQWRPLSRIRRGGFFLCMCLLALPQANGGKFNRVLEIGDRAPRFAAIPGVDGKNYNADSFASGAMTIVVFTCNSCPYSVDVQQRLVDLDAKVRVWGGQLVAINVNKTAEDRFPAMQTRATEAGFRFPYLFDESQKVARDFGATTTPEFFLLDSQWRVVYMGALDNSPDGKEITERYLETAMENLREGKEQQTTETLPIGCRIRFDRSRRVPPPR